MKRILYIILFTILSALAPGAQAQSSAQIGYSDVRITRSGDYVDISFEVTAGRKSVGRGEQLMLTPVLFNDSRRVVLPFVSVQSRRVQLQEFRAGKHLGSRDAPAYITHNGGKIRYSTRIAYSDKLTNIFLRIESVRQQCDSKWAQPATTLTERASLVPTPIEVEVAKEITPMVPAESIADSLSKLYTFIAPIADFERSKQAKGYKLFDMNMPLNMGKGTSQPQQNAVERFVANNEKGAIQINFSRGSSTIDRYFGQNNPSLVVLASALKEIQASTSSRVVKIVVAGFASPEGPLDVNDRLAWERADAVRTFIRGNSNVPFNDILLYNGSEDWRGLREMVEQSDIEAKYEILYIIDNVPIIKGREKQLMDLAGGRPYKFMLRYFFPRLRNAAYIKVYYNNTAETPAVK